MFGKELLFLYVCAKKVLDFPEPLMEFSVGQKTSSRKDTLLDGFSEGALHGLRTSSGSYGHRYLLCIGRACHCASLIVGGCSSCGCQVVLRALGAQGLVVWERCIVFDGSVR